MERDAIAQQLESVGLDRADVYDAFLLRGEQIEAIVDFIEYIAARAGRPVPGRALDGGCGTGRLLPALVRRGWRVTGVEPDADYLRRARRRMSEIDAEIDAAAADVSLLPCRLDAIPAEPRFDVAALVNGPFVYLLDDAARAATLRALFAALAPGGAVWLDCPNFLWILRNYRPPQTQEARVGDLVVRREPHHDIDYHDARFVHRDAITVLRDGRAVAAYRETFRFAVLSAPQIRAALADAGFADVESYGDYGDRAPRRADGPRIMFTARRP
jgi:SAM-dependent methyltransferase